MANFVKLAKALTLAKVQNKWGRTVVGRAKWRKNMIAEASGAASFARYSSGTPHSGDLNIEVDTTSVSVAVQ